MGMLTLAGVVSGGGKALQQSLQQTQQYMSQSMLLKEREDMERERLKLTFAHDRGMLQERAGIDRDIMREREGLQQANAKELKSIDEASALKRLEVGHGYDKETAANKAASDRELEEVRQKNRIAELVATQGYSQQAAERKAAEERAEKARERAAKRTEMEHITGRDIVLKGMELQKPRGGSSSPGEGKWDDQTKARERSLVNEIDDLKEKIYGLVKAPEKEQPALKKRLADLQKEHDELIGRKSTQSERAPIRWPQ